MTPPHEEPPEPAGFDPDAPAMPGSGLYGLPHGPEAAIHVIEVPFDATTSYRRGTAYGPAAVAAASHQVDLHDRLFGDIWREGLFLVADDGRIADWNDEARRLADPIIARGGDLGDDPQLLAHASRVDVIGAEVNGVVRKRTEDALFMGKIPGILGGDHASPFGAMQAVADQVGSYGILHIDAHADLRPAYEGFRWSHASIMHNALEQIGGITKLVQVGIRDLGRAEARRIEADARIHTLFDESWAGTRMRGQDLAVLARKHIASLPDRVWISFDIDGLEPALCPNTGTPVPGGLDWHGAMLFLMEVANSGRRIIGFDLCEVAPGPDPDPDGSGWDAVVGARLLYRLAGAALRSQSTPSKRT